jgi:hypothetical protein
MSHYIRVIIAREKLIQRLADTWQTAHIISLKQDFCLIPLTDELHDEIISEYPPESGEGLEEFILLSPPIQAILANHSQSGPIAYIETDYFGGEGSQSAILYEGGDIKTGPRQSKWPGAINGILRELGVKRTLPYDRFDTLGLGTFRNNDDILEKNND